MLDSDDESDAPKSKKKAYDYSKLRDDISLTFCTTSPAKKATVKKPAAAAPPKKAPARKAATKAAKSIELFSSADDSSADEGPSKKRKR